MSTGCLLRSFSDQRSRPIVRRPLAVATGPRNRQPIRSLPMAMGPTNRRTIRYLPEATGPLSHHTIRTPLLRLEVMVRPAGRKRSANSRGRPARVPRRVGGQFARRPCEHGCGCRPRVEANELRSECASHPRQHRSACSSSVGCKPARLPRGDGGGRGSSIEASEHRAASATTPEPHFSRPRMRRRGSVRHAFG